MHGAPVATTEDQEAPVPAATNPEDRVSHWINKGFLALVATGATLLLAFGGWIISSLNEINTSTRVVAVEFATTKQDIGELKSSVDSLRLRGESWATKDSLNASKEGILDKISKLKDQVNVLELRVQRMETSGPALPPPIGRVR